MVESIQVGTNLGDLLINQPLVQVHLLMALPTSLNPLTWSVPLFPWYTPATARMSILDDFRPSAVVYLLQPEWILDEVVSGIVGIGGVYLGQGLFAGEATDPLGRALPDLVGLVKFPVTVCYQNWVAP